MDISTLPGLTKRQANNYIVMFIILKRLPLREYISLLNNKHKDKSNQVNKYISSQAKEIISTRESLALVVDGSFN